MSRPKRQLLQATSFRLALAHAAVFLALFVSMGAGGLVLLHHVQLEALDASITAQAAKLETLGARAGSAPFLHALSVLQKNTADWEIRLSDHDGRRLVGDLPDVGWPVGFATRTLVEGDQPHGAAETVRARTQRLADGARLTLGRDLGPLNRSGEEAAAVLALGAIVALISVLGLGWGMSRRVLRRLTQMDAVMAAFAQGDVQARVGASSARSDLDDLAASMDAMLDHIASLTEGLRRVSASVAHDLKRPLIQHNLEIADALAGPQDAERLRSALEGATRRTDEAIAIFDTMLRLAELDAGAPGLPRSPVDVRAVATRVVAAYAPRAEDEGRSLQLVEGVTAEIQANERLLGLMLANMIDNGLVHTPIGSRVEVRVTPTPPQIAVWDSGPGVAPEELLSIFDPFHRADPARTTPGSGLGLALVASAARALGAEVEARMSQGGFEVVLVFADANDLAPQRVSSPVTRPAHHLTAG